MSYLVLARKYRPGTFADIVGQEHVVRTLRNAIRLDRVHHAFLFCGARGVGKTTTARVLARALNCQNGPTEEPCGTCAACVEIASGASPDVIEIDGASNRGVDSVRELREAVRYMPSRGRHKLYIIDEVHQLTSEAFNALLKTLEEPPSHVKFIFATTEPQKIPATILSRCQRFDFRRVGLAALAEHVRGILSREGMSLSPTAIAAIVREAQGSVRDALSLLDQVLSYAGDKPDDGKVIEALGVLDRELVFSTVQAILERNADKLLGHVADVDSRGHDLAELAGLLVEHFRDLMVAKVVENPSEALLNRSPGELEALRAQAQALSRPDLHRYFTLLVGVAEDVSRSTSPRVSLEMGLLRLFEVEPVHSLGNLLAKLDKLLGSAPTGKVAASAARNSTEGPSVRPAPGPESEASGAGRPAADSSWNALVERIRRQHPALASVLEHGRPIEFEAKGVILAYPAGTFYWDAANEKENRRLFERVLTEHFGRAVPLRLQTLESQAAVDVASLAESREQRRSQRESEIRAGALEHPAVQGAISILGGEVKEVIPLAGEPGDPSDQA